MVIHFHWYVYCWLVVAGFIANTIDALAGGGGLIALPALLITGMNPVVAFGTNKLQAVVGELSASLHFIYNKHINYHSLKLGIIYVTLGSIVGTLLLQIIPTVQLEKLIPFFLLAVLLYYILQHRNYHDYHDIHLSANAKRLSLLGILIGFYNGFFGPGTGSMWIVALMKAFKLNLRAATMYAKPLNVAGNMAALIVFFAIGKLDFIAAAFMMIGSVIGAKVGARLVVYQELRWLRLVFLSVMSVSTLTAFLKYTLGL